MPVSALVSFAEALEVGYSKYKSPYHQQMRATGVTQAVRCLLFTTGAVVGPGVGILNTQWDYSHLCSVRRLSLPTIEPICTTGMFMWNDCADEGKIFAFGFSVQPTKQNEMEEGENVLIVLA